MCTVIGLLKTKDSAAFEIYKAGVPATLPPYQGEVIGRGAFAETFANEREMPEVDAVALLQFPSLEQAKRWANGPEYQALIPVRNQAIELTLRAFSV